MPRRPRQKVCLNVASDLHLEMPLEPERDLLLARLGTALAGVLPGDNLPAKPETTMEERSQSENED